MSVSSWEFSQFYVKIDDDKLERDNTQRVARDRAYTIHSIHKSSSVEKA